MKLSDWYEEKRKQIEATGWRRHGGKVGDKVKLHAEWDWHEDDFYEIIDGKEHGGDRKSSVHVHLKDETPKGNSRARRIKTLKRDAPDIAERVINNELSAAAGMRELRIRNGEPEELRRAVNMLDARSTFNSLVKFMPDDVLQELIDLLNDKERP